MTVSGKDIEAQVAHRVGAKTHFSAIQYGNLAGEWLFGAHQWKFLQGAVATLDLVKDQNYVVLPTDIKSVDDIDTTSITSGFQLTTHGRILQLRKNVAGSTNYYEATIEWALPASGKLPKVPRLAVWPAISATDIGAISIYYRRYWTQLTQDNDTVDIPPFMDGLYLHTVREYAAGYEDEEPGAPNLDQILNGIRFGPLWNAAEKTDAGVQSHYGVMTNGMAESERWAGHYWRDRTIPGPS